MPQPTTVKDCMRRQPLTIRPDASLAEAVKLITEHGLTGLTVTDEAGTVKGVLSELDCLRGILEINGTYLDCGSIALIDHKEVQLKIPEKSLGLRVQLDALDLVKP